MEHFQKLIRIWILRDIFTGEEMISQTKKPDEDQLNTDVKFRNHTCFWYHEYDFAASFNNIIKSSDGLAA
ncbi:MAG: hypothetical protein IPH62_19460 [Ignavibacteriae bacterium]|nr:hypothetical protein [Ignavibacteriota bacterium]